MKFTPRLPRWVWVVLTVIVAWCIVQQALLRPLIETVATQVVGARVTLGGFSFNVFTDQVRVTDLKIYNEPGFPPGVFLTISELSVKTDLLKAVQGKLHFPLIVFRLDKMIVYKNAQGRLNVDELKVVKDNLHAKNKGPLPSFRIDELRLNIDQVIVEDESQTPALVEAYDLNLKDKTFYNIDSVNKLLGLVMFETLKPTAIQSVGLYAATTLLGVAFLPGLAIGIAIAPDAALAELSHPRGEVFDRALALVKRLGLVKKTEPSSGHIWAKVYGCDITIEVHDDGWLRSGVTIKARKYFLARPEIAAGLLYQLKEGL